MSTNAERYFSIRDRIVGAVTGWTDGQHDAVVPACPDWTVHQLLTHVVATPMAITAGDLPDSADVDGWLQGLVDRHCSRPVEDLCAWWESDDVALEALCERAGVLVGDLFVHESDLHGAVGSHECRDTPELASHLELSVVAFGNDIAAADPGLAPVRVATGTGDHRTGEGDPGWTLRVDAWEAHRALNSRRTRSELLTLPADGDASPYLDVLHDHLPLPDVSLGE